MPFHILWHFIGGDSTTTPQYAFWSGFAGDLAIFGAVIAYVRHKNCHVKGCPRLGRHAVQGTDHVVCRKHHPQDTPTAQDVLDDHHAARQRR